MFNMFEVLCFAQAPLTYYNASGVSQPKKKEMKKKRKMVAAAAGMKAMKKEWHSCVWKLFKNRSRRLNGIRRLQPRMYNIGETNHLFFFTIALAFVSNCLNITALSFPWSIWIHTYPFYIIWFSAPCLSASFCCFSLFCLFVFLNLHSKTKQNNSCLNPKP